MGPNSVPQSARFPQAEYRMATNTDILTLDSHGQCDPLVAYEFARHYLVEGLTSPGRQRAELGAGVF